VRICGGNQKATARMQASEHGAHSPKELTVNGCKGEPEEM